jgi:hypothetical protein
MKKALLPLALGLSLFAQTLPEATTIEVRLIDSIDSSKAKTGDTFAASVNSDVVVNGRTLVAKGSNARVKLVDLDKSGKMTGKTELAVVLDNVTASGQVIPVQTGEVTRVSGSQTKNTALKTGVGAGIGAAIGAIAGGGKGAAIGAGVGGAAGAGSQIFTKGQKVQIPSESVLRFTTSASANLPRVARPAPTRKNQ